jgi:hypothetical protein
VDAFRQRQRRVVELYWDKPDDCPNGARAFTLQGAWVTPTIGGAIVWACR